MATLSVRLPDGVFDRLSNYARRSRLTRSQIVRAALDLGLMQLQKNPELMLDRPDLDDELADAPQGDLAEISRRLIQLSEELDHYVRVDSEATTSG